MKLVNTNVIITGANQGLGFAIAERFIKEGASISICARNSDKLNNTITYLKSIVTQPAQKVCGMVTDVSKENEVNKFVDYSISELKKIDVVINNAGVYGPKGLIETVDTKEWVYAIETNLFSIFYMCKRIIPHMKKNGSGKIINLSGGGATNPLPRLNSYATSKAAVVRLTETLAEEYAGTRIDINAIAPGALNTRLLEEVLDAGPEIIGEKFYKKAVQQKQSGGVPLEKGVDLCVYLSTKESDGVTGKLISAVWDPWQEFGRYKEELKNTDIYTLRRIVPEDRNKKWS